MVKTPQQLLFVTKYEERERAKNTTPLFGKERDGKNTATTLICRLVGNQLFNSDPIRNGNQGVAMILDQ